GATKATGGGGTNGTRRRGAEAVRRRPSTVAARPRNRTAGEPIRRRYRPEHRRSSRCRESTGWRTERGFDRLYPYPKKDVFWRLRVSPVGPRQAQEHVVGHARWRADGERPAVRQQQCLFGAGHGLARLQLDQHLAGARGLPRRRIRHGEIIGPFTFAKRPPSMPNLVSNRD